MKSDSDLNFLAGSYLRFKDYVEKINLKDRVALISHVDLDGLASAKVIQESIGQITKIKLIKFVGYDEINLIGDLLPILRKNKITKVIFSDLAIDNKEVLERISEFSDILIIDHHLFEIDFNNDKIVFINIQEHCATYLCYLLFSTFDNQKKLEKIDWLVACACVADWKYFNNKDFMEKVYKKYGDSFEIVKNDHGEIRKNGLMWDMQWDITLALIYFKEKVKKVYELIESDFNKVRKDGIRKYSSIVKTEIERNINLFEKEKEIYGDVFLWVMKGEKYPVRSIVSTLISSKYRNNTVIILMKKGDKYLISARRQDKKQNVVDILKNLTIGFKDSFCGGHMAAGGGHFLAKDLGRVRERLNKI